VVGLLLADDTRLLTLLAPGGVGKTRLAIAVAEKVLTRGGVEVVFVDLAPVRDADRLLDHIGHALDADEEASEQAGPPRECLSRPIPGNEILRSDDVPADPVRYRRGIKENAAPTGRDT
jgi:cellulose biosynthesis protein BcsQ